MKLAILGASKPHLPLYLKAKEMGIETYCIAWSKGAYCKDYADHFCDISILDKEAIAELCIREHIDGIVANALEKAVPTIAYIHEKCGLNGNSQLTALRTTNKKEMRKRVHETNACPQPFFQILKKNDIPSVSHYPVIVKPEDSSASNGISKVNNQEELQTAIDRAFSVSKTDEILIEQYIEGREISVESISYEGKHYFLTITDKETTGAPYFVETAQHEPSNLPNEIKLKIKKYNDSLLSALEINNSASHAEFKIDNKGNVYFIEVGSRGGGDFISYNLVEMSTGYDFIKGMIEVALKKFTPPIISKKYHAGVYFLSKNTKYIKDFILKNKDKSFIFDYSITDENLKELKCSQDRSGYVIYKSDHKILINEGI